jgi:hypothetical protein
MSGPTYKSPETVIPVSATLRPSWPFSQAGPFPPEQSFTGAAANGWVGWLSASPLAGQEVSKSDIRLKARSGGFTIAMQRRSLRGRYSGGTDYAD